MIPQIAGRGARASFRPLGLAMVTALIGALTLGLGPLRRAPPRLVVWLVVDQGRADSASRLEGALSRGGFRRFMERGAWFTDAHYRHLATWTASGHATLATGAYADRHGLMSNYWFEGGRFVEAAAGDDAEAGGAGHARAATVGDALRLADPRSKVVSVSLKDRAALIMAGAQPTGLYWFDTATGAFVGRGAQGDAPATWASAFNDSGAVDAPFGSTWEARLPLAVRAAQTPVDDCPFEADSYGLGRTFPHPVNGGLDAPGRAYYKALLRAPQGTGLLLDFALAAVEGEGLGQDDDPDLLFVSVSTTDYVGHAFGMQSWEVSEIMGDLDRRLGPFIDALEKRVGRGRVGVVLSADHGGPPIPECVADQVDGGRISYDDVVRVVEEALIARFGLRGGQTQLGSDGGWVVGFEAPGLWLDIPPGVDAGAVRAEATAALMGLDGMMGVCDTSAPSGPWAEACARSTVQGRAPDLMLIGRPYYIFSKAEHGGLGTTHGGPHAYDTGVLMGLWGPGIRRGVVGERAEVARLAPTVAAWLGIPPPAAAEWGPLTEALEPR